MTDRLTDEYTIKKIYENSEIKLFNDELKDILKEVVKELYYSSPSLINKLQLKHIDRAIYKFRQAKEKNSIHNTKKYFKACILSAIREVGLDEL